MGYMLRRATNREWKQPKRKKCGVVKKAEKWRFGEGFDIGHGDAEFGVCPAEFWSSFGPVFPHYASFPTFWNCSAYSVPLYIGSM